MINKTRYIPVSKWDEYHPWPSVSALRALIKKKDKNGFDDVIVKVNKRVLIDEEAFYEWVEGFKKNRVCVGIDHTGRKRYIKMEPEGEWTIKK